MQHGYGSNGSDLGLSLLENPSTASSGDQYTRRRMLRLGAIVLFSISGLSACGLGSNDSCLPSAQTPLTSTPTDPKFYNNLLLCYFQLLLEGENEQAYDMLSKKLRARISFAQFKHNYHFVLKEGCWTTPQIVLSRQEGPLWHVGAELSQPPCPDSKTADKETIWYFWDAYNRIEDSHAVFTDMLLRPTAVNC